MTRLPDTDYARLPLGTRGAFEGVARWPWMASGMGTDDAHTPPTNRPRHRSQRVVEKVARSITNSETPHQDRPQPPGRHSNYATASHGRERQRRPTLTIASTIHATRTGRSPQRQSGVRHLGRGRRRPAGVPDDVCFLRMRSSACRCRLDWGGSRFRPDPSVGGPGSSPTAFVLVPAWAALSQRRPSANPRRLDANRRRASRCS